MTNWRFYEDLATAGFILFTKADDMYTGSYRTSYMRWPNPPDPGEETEILVDTDLEGEWNCEVPVEETEKEIKKITVRTCFEHKWKLYQGIMEAYEYCTECDTKRKDKE